MDTIPSKPANDPNALEVLFVDDSPNLCRAMELWLKSSGYRTKIALTAAQAEEIAISENPKVIITDIGLPDASGFELRQRILESPNMARTRFIALSGKRGQSIPRKAFSSGFDWFISKPPDFEELSTLLRECLPEHAS